MTTTTTNTREPVLARKTISVDGAARNLIVLGGLHMIKGNGWPYFTLTAIVQNPARRSDCESCGCLHALILKHFPRFAGLAKLHLSSISGIPMHAEPNGWYKLAGCLPDHAGERFHAGNSMGNFPKPADAPRKGNWNDTDYRFATADECLQQFADHCRIDLDTARSLRDSVITEWTRTRALNESPASPEPAAPVEPAAPPTDGTAVDPDPVWSKASWKGARAYFGAWIREQYPRWQREADECIERHALVVFGDTWGKPAAEEVRS